MKAKILGIILSILGISGLVLALVYMNEVADSGHVIALSGGGLLAAAIFFSGIWLLPKERRDVKTLEVR